MAVHLNAICNEHYIEASLIKGLILVFLMVNLLLSNYVISFTCRRTSSVSGIFPPVVKSQLSYTVCVLKEISLSYPWLFRVQAGTDV